VLLGLARPNREPRDSVALVPSHRRPPRLPPYPRCSASCARSICTSLVTGQVEKANTKMNTIPTRGTTVINTHQPELCALTEARDLRSLIPALCDQ
jgi:hypothetical protein